MTIEVNATIGKTPVFFRANSEWATLFSSVGTNFNYWLKFTLAMPIYFTELRILCLKTFYYVA